MTGRAQQLGRVGEALARLYYEACGYVTVQERYRKREGEIDLIVSRGPLVVFVEVKARRSGRYGVPEAAVTPAKLSRMRHLARHFLAEFPQPRGRMYRFDVIAVEMKGEGDGLRLRHLAGVG